MESHLFCEERVVLFDVVANAKRILNFVEFSGLKKSHLLSYAFVAPNVEWPRRNAHR